MRTLKIFILLFLCIFALGFEMPFKNNKFIILELDEIYYINIAGKVKKDLTGATWYINGKRAKIRSNYLLINYSDRDKDSSFSIKVEKEGYLTREIMFNYKCNALIS